MTRRRPWPLLLWLAAAQPALAQAEPPDHLSLTWENDLMAGTDRHYTNGLRLELGGPLDPHAVPELLSADDLDWCLAVGQQIYTPERLYEVRTLSYDRPYAGWAYLSAAIQRRFDACGFADQLELTLGVVGPWAGARESQLLAHDVLASIHSRGWRHQLTNEPGVGLSYRASAELLRARALGLTWDLRPGLGGSVGNVATYAALGVTLRCGVGVPEGYPARDKPCPFRCYLQASAETRYVVHDIFVEGSLLHRDGLGLALQAGTQELADPRQRLGRQGAQVGDLAPGQAWPPPWPTTWTNPPAAAATARPRERGCSTSCGRSGSGRSSTASSTACWPRPGPRPIAAAAR